MELEYLNVNIEIPLKIIVERDEAGRRLPIPTLIAPYVDEMTHLIRYGQMEVQHLLGHSKTCSTCSDVRDGTSTILSRHGHKESRHNDIERLCADHETMWKRMDLSIDRLCERIQAKENQKTQ